MLMKAFLAGILCLCGLAHSSLAQADVVGSLAVEHDWSDPATWFFWPGGSNGVPDSGTQVRIMAGYRAGIHGPAAAWIGVIGGDYASAPPSNSVLTIYAGGTLTMADHLS